MTRGALREYMAREPDARTFVVERAELASMLDLAEEADRLREVLEAAQMAAKALTGGELFIDDLPGINLIKACAEYDPSNKQLRAAIAAAEGR